jgi:hypothetical protein
MLKILVLAFGLALLIAAPASAAEQKVVARDNGQIEFAMPSGNVGCLYTPAGGTDVYEPKDGGPELICERIEPQYVTVILGPKGAPQMIEDPEEQSCCGAENILDYGNTVTFEGFTCLAETSGLTCEVYDGDDAADDSADDADDAEDDAEDDSADADDSDEAVHGFRMARAGIELF